MAIDVYGISLDRARDYFLESDEVVFIQDLLDADTTIRECERNEFYKSPDHTYNSGVFVPETRRAYIYTEALKLTNLMVGLDINDVIERLKSKGYIFESQVLTRKVVALNWEYFNGDKK